jgi:branched-chain amino acid transport system substrate-binding protein
VNRSCFFCLICLLWGAVCSIFVAACDENKSSRSHSEPIKIGVIYPFSGPDTATGEDLKAGAELALEIINGVFDLPLPLAQSEGLPNRGNGKIQIIYRDSKSTPEVAAALVEELFHQEHVKGIIGCYSSTVTAAASERAEMLKIPFLNAASTSPTLTQRGFIMVLQNDAQRRNVCSEFFHFPF